MQIAGSGRLNRHFSRQANLSQAAPGSLCSVQLGKKVCLPAQKRQIPHDRTRFPNVPISDVADKTMTSRVRWTLQTGRGKPVIGIACSLRS